MQEMCSVREVPATPKNVMPRHACLLCVVITQLFQRKPTLHPVLQWVDSNHDVEDRFGPHAWHHRGAVVLNTLGDVA